MNFAPIDAPTTLLPQRQTTEEKTQRVLRSSISAITLYRLHSNSISLGNIIQSVVGVQHSLGITVATGIRTDASTVLIPGHAALNRQVKIVDYRGKESISQVRHNYYPEQDMALVTNAGKAHPFEYYLGGAFGQQDYLLFFHDGKLLAKELVTLEGQMLNETMRGLSGGVMISLDPYGEFKVTGIHVGEGHVLQGSDIANLPSVHLVGPSLVINESEIARVGGYGEEARYPFSDKGKSKGFDVMEIDGQSRNWKRKGSITFYDLNDAKVIVEFSCEANKSTASAAYHRNPAYYYKRLGNKIGTLISQNPAQTRFAFQCHLGTDSTADIISISAKEKPKQEVLKKNRSNKNFYRKMVA